MERFGNADKPDGEAEKKGEAESVLRLQNLSIEVDVTLHSR